MNKKKEEKNRFENIRNWFYMIKFISKNSPFLLFFSVFFFLLQDLPWMLSNVVLLKYILDVVSDGTALYRAAVAVAAFAAIVILGNIGNSVFWEYVLPTRKEKLYQKLYSAIYEKAAKIDLSAYDDPKFYNDFVLSMNKMWDKTEEIIRLTRNMVEMVLFIAIISGVILSIDPICLIFVLACIAGMIPIGRVIAKVTVEREEAMTPLDRKNLYYSRVFYLKDYAKELRLNPAGEMIERRYNKNIFDRLDTITGYLKKQWKLYFCHESLPMTIGVYLAVALYMGWRAIQKGDVGLGDFAATFNGVSSVSESVFYLTTFYAINFRETSLYIGKFKRFMNTEEKIVSGTLTDILEKPKPIKLNNVSFTYPGNDKPTLKNISIEIKPYQKIALVGYNGAGKTTLTNLLLRLYDVSDGSITVDGTDIRDWDIRAYHDHFAAVFQDYSLFGATIGENVSMDEHPDAERVKKALAESGFSKELPKGSDTVLLREFDDDGLSLSGGEAQKVAIARTFYKNCPFAILDEPSANLDPMAEFALNDAMARAAHDKTVIFISHRLSTTVMADVIYMLENGEVVESGSHEELMALDGKYAYMFKLQAEKYKS